ncbi:TRZ/ATZ family protein [Lachnospiraceae bacterium]|nr:TRZ/ATZ family protein [Lachnospiraceae bacterium]
MDKHIATPITSEITRELHAGDYVYISGTIYVARDAAHKRFMETLDNAEELSESEHQEEAGKNRLAEALPFPLENAAIYYMGPSPAREGRPIGSAGPTTASRMDKYAPRLLDLGQKAMIGKGKRSQSVIDAIVRNQAVYFAAVGGAGALLSKCIKKSDLVCYGDLGAEAVLKLEVEDFPVVVVVDCQGNNLYETAVRDYVKEL